MDAFSIILALFFAWFCTYLWALVRNYIHAKRSGFPVVLCPVDPDNALYMVIKVPLRPVFERLLPRSWYEAIHLSIYGWEFRAKYEYHKRLGPTFILANPGSNELWTADPSVAQQVLTRRKDFVVLPMTSVILGFLGSNILTSNGDTWARQRRLVAPNLNERISESVWEESFKQAGQMADFLIKQASTGTTRTIDGLRSIAINVLGQAGYGQPQQWSDKTEADVQNDKPTYFQAIATIVDYLILAAVVPTSLMCMPFMPAMVRKVGLAVRDAPKFADEMMAKERSNEEKGLEAKNNMMSVLVRLAGQENEKDPHSGSTGGQYLSLEEIRGNLFIFTAAGFDTTANTMAYAVVLLAAYPQWQDWLREELDEVFGTPNGTATFEYTSHFPRLTRCLAIMYETLRLFPPVIHLSRSTELAQSVTTDSGSHQISPNTKVHINNVGLHVNTATWGPDSHEFKPTRWLSTDASAEGPLINPARGTFLPWSIGPRACPGQKMSQVEFTAVFARLFHECAVEPVPLEGETVQQAREKLPVFMQDSQSRLTLQMNRPDELKLRWIQREA